jgi:hypothetical protein
MIAAARFVSLLALVGTIWPAVLFVNGSLPLDRMKLWMLIASVVWFTSAPLWMDREASPNDRERRERHGAEQP